MSTTQDRSNIAERRQAAITGVGHTVTLVDDIERPALEGVCSCGWTMAATPEAGGQPDSRFWADARKEIGKQHREHLRIVRLASPPLAARSTDGPWSWPVYVVTVLVVLLASLDVALATDVRAFMAAVVMAAGAAFLGAALARSWP